ncbi:glucokinase [Celerinatantimonas diazotrophica]|uniref:Glucokinase n=1 Tax=Celerinatantimonas diazotrophica TaxID=412034 RepID=A0A4R1J7P4_9GAMM|nr:glucokinase [Celerinatantimonas diazotrophica]TCK46482.1 glucokinase [Celerinatantimonas diazotrophica]CAG9296532.1 Glucokinase [Celerinatantimonas diazotrophica]
MASAGLIADVGGTNIRLGVIDYQSGEIRHIIKYRCSEFPGIEDAIRSYLNEVDEKLQEACIAIACPTGGDWIAMTNHSWAFSRSETKRNLGLESFNVINDFTANAMSIPTLSDKQKIQIGGGPADPLSPISVYGPGTGLGVAHLVNHQGRYIPISCEGGHADFSPISELEVELLSFLKGRFGRVSNERILSGPGLANIYEALCHIHQQPVQQYQPADVSAKGLSGEDSVCRQALAMFCQMMGSFGGNLALTLGAFGGVYIAGGVVGNFVDYFIASDFRNRFEEKGRFSRYCGKIPVYLITAEQPGLQGAAAYLRQELGYHLNAKSAK